MQKVSISMIRTFVRSVNEHNPEHRSGNLGNPCLAQNERFVKSS